MKKTFCDRCEDPAAESYPEIVIDGSGKMFRKKIATKGLFEICLDSSNCTRREPIDLCASCQVDLLKLLITKIQGDQ